MQRVTYPNNTYTAYTYYDNNKLHTVQSVNHNGATVEAYNYAYDQNGNPTTVLDQNGQTEYTYTTQNQLASEELYNGKLTQYTYDAAGNRTQQSVYDPGQTQAQVTQYTYNARNLLTQTITQNPNGAQDLVEFFYDRNGNLYSKLHSTLAPGAAGDQSVSLSDYA